MGAVTRQLRFPSAFLVVILNQKYICLQRDVINAVIQPIRAVATMRKKDVINAVIQPIRAAAITAIIIDIGQQ